MTLRSRFFLQCSSIKGHVSDKHSMHIINGSDLSLFTAVMTTLSKVFSAGQLSHYNY